MVSDTKVATKTTEIRISGYGGQGVVLTGMLLGKAASLYDGKEGVFTQSYGPEARGGASCADVVVADGPVDYPLVSRPDVLVTLFQEAYMRYRPALKDEGTLILESTLVKPNADEGRYYGIAATELADELGRRIVANVVVLGYVVGLTEIVSPESLEKAIETTVRAKLVDLNIRAFRRGLEEAQRATR